MSIISSLYRDYLRQVRALPHHYLRTKATDDFRSVLKTESAQLRENKLKRISKDLRRLRAANRGQSTAFDRVLDVAYGRVGKLRHELMEPLLLDPDSALAVSRKEITSIPTYSPELASLLSSGISHTTRALHKHHLASPPGLPERAKPNSPDANLLGPLSRRREHNIRWRFFESERKKVYPPLEISCHPSDHDNMSDVLSYSGFQNPSILQGLLALAGSPSRSPGPPSKQRMGQQLQNTSDRNQFDGSLPIRWLRRRYQALLGRIPLLILKKSSQQDNCKRTYDIQLADNAMVPSRPCSSRLRVVDAEDMSWISDVHLAVRPRRHRK